MSSANFSSSPITPVGRLPGMRDLGSHASRGKRSVQSRLNEFIGSYGYGALEVPVLEATELFLRKSGGALASQMYSFTDPGPIRSACARNSRRPSCATTWKLHPALRPIR